MEDARHQIDDFMVEKLAVSIALQMCADKSFGIVKNLSFAECYSYGE